MAIATATNKQALILQIPTAMPTRVQVGMPKRDLWRANMYRRRLGLTAMTFTYSTRCEGGMNPKLIA